VRTLGSSPSIEGGRGLGRRLIAKQEREGGKASISTGKLGRGGRHPGERGPEENSGGKSSGEGGDID